MICMYIISDSSNDGKTQAKTGTLCVCVCVRKLVCAAEIRALSLSLMMLTATSVLLRENVSGFHGCAVQMCKLSIRMSQSIYLS